MEKQFRFYLREKTIGETEGQTCYLSKKPQTKSEL